MAFSFRVQADTMMVFSFRVPDATTAIVATHWRTARANVFEAKDMLVTICDDNCTFVLQRPDVQFCMVVVAMPTFNPQIPSAMRVHLPSERRVFEVMGVMSAKRMCLYDTVEDFLTCTETFNE